MSDYTLTGLHAVQDRFRASDALTELPRLPSAPHIPFGAWTPGVLSEEAEQGALLYSIEAAGERYRILSLGAAPGEWAIKAERAYRWLHPKGDFRSFCVEGDLVHADMIHEYLALTGADIASHDVRHAVIAQKDGVALFPIIHPAVDWGAGIASLADSPDQLEDNFSYSGEEQHYRVLANNGNPLEFREVAALSLTTIIDQMGLIDFLHCDVQGAEETAFAPHMAAIRDNIRLLCISAHSVAIEQKLKKLFAPDDWILQADYTCEFGENGNLFRDGTLIFLNRRFAGGLPERADDQAMAVT